jgi:hypothetical protein
VAGEYKAEMVISDYKRIIRELNKMEGELVSEMRKGMKDIAEPVRAGVRAAIPSRAPIRGMVRKLSPVGKTWNTGKRARTVRIVVRSPKRSSEKSQAIAQLVVDSPATIIADMAQRSGANDGKMTDWYVYPRSETTSENYRPGERRHKVNGQGAGLLKALEGRIGSGDKSRMVYPAAEKKLPAAQQKFADLMFTAADKIERKIDG